MNENNSKPWILLCLSAGYWSSPEDVLGIVILLITFPFVAVDLVRRGGWHGCALSVSWCVSYDDPANRTDGLPTGSMQARIAAICGTCLAMITRITTVWKKRKNLRELNWRGQIAVSGLLLSNLGMVSCAFVPMSCGALVDGVEWVALSWRDPVHDYSLLCIYLFAIISGFSANYHKVGAPSNKRWMLFGTCVSSVLQSMGIFRCPTSSGTERVALLILEVAAIALTQFLHYSTVNHLVLAKYPSSSSSSLPSTLPTFETKPFVVHL